MAYIIPAYKVFDDIENRFGVLPRLPSETASETATDSIQNYIIRSSEPTHNCTTAPQSSTAASNFDDLVCKVRLPRKGSKSPPMYNLQCVYIPERPRVESISPRLTPRIRFQRPAKEFFGYFSNRTAYSEPWSAAFGQRTRCYRIDTSRPQFPAVYTREGCSKQVQTLEKSYSRAPLVTERRRTRILAQALDTGGEPLRDSLLLFSADYNDSYYEALSYEWGEAVNGTFSKDRENLGFALYPMQGLTTLWYDSVCNDQRDWREVHAQVSRMDDANANATRMKVLLSERAAYSYATIAFVHPVQAMIPADVEELEPQDTTMHCYHPVRRVPPRLSSLLSSDSVSLDNSRWSFRMNLPDTLGGFRAFDPLRPTTYLESATRAAHHLAQLASRLTGFSRDPPQHLNDDAKALTSRFNDLLRSRRQSESRAACGSWLRNLEQHRATLGNHYYRRLPIASMGDTKHHVVLVYHPATFSSLQQFLLQDRRDATTSFGLLQLSLCGLVAIPLWHDENSLVGYYNAAAHLQGTLQSSRDGTGDRIPAKSLLSLIIELHGLSFFFLL